jgi:peroxidase
MATVFYSCLYWRISVTSFNIIADILLGNFANRDLLHFAGAHSVGLSQCQFFSDRLYNFNGTLQPDPTLNTTYLLFLQKLCPQNGNGTTTVPLNNFSQFKLDNSYYIGARMGMGLLRIDQDITAQVNTSAYVNAFAGVPRSLNMTFNTSFVNSYIKMARNGLKTSIDGEVRKICEVPN